MSAETMDAFLDRKLSELRRSHYQMTIDLVEALRPVAEGFRWSPKRTMDEIRNMLVAQRDETRYEPQP